MAKRPKKPPQRIRTELVRWEYIERYSRKGWLTRNFCIGGHWYRWCSNGVSPEGYVRYGILDPSLQEQMV